MTETTLPRVRAIWADILNLSEIGEDDHFVDLGGDSIAASMCITRMMKEFDIKIPVDILMRQETTLKALTALIDTTMFRGTSGPVST